MTPVEGLQGLTPLCVEWTRAGEKEAGYETLWVQWNKRIGIRKGAEWNAQNILSEVRQREKDVSHPVSLIYWNLTELNSDSRASLVAHTVKNSPAMWETWVHSLGWEDRLEGGMATHSSMLAWRIPWTEEPGGLQSMGLQRVRQRLSD